MLDMCCIVFFFFQAEDGIRDLTVTGVQTCALPISVAMPNTFAMSPGYVAKYIARHRLVPPDVDVVSFLEGRTGSLCWPDGSFRRGRGWMHAVETDIAWPADVKHARLIFASPPYLQVIKYGKYNW